MSLPLPLAVRLRTSQADRHVSRDLRDLTLRSAVPGGFTSATLSFHRPLALQPSEVDYFADVIVYDKRTGETVWEGSLEDPGRAVGRDGQVWSLAAIGAAGHAHDINRARIYVDRDSQAFFRFPDAGAVAGANVSVETDGLQEQFLSGTPVVGGSTVTAYYDRFQNASQGLAYFEYSWAAGANDGNILIEGVSSVDGLTDVTQRSDASNIAGGALLGFQVPLSHNLVKLRLRWLPAGAGTINVDSYWARFKNVAIVARRRTKAGVSITAGGSYSGTVLASQVVEDLLGVLLTRYDGANAVVTPTTYAIQQLAYPDGIDPAGILADLMQFEPDFYWAAWERNPANRKYRFEWLKWPTTIRYEASIEDGFDAPGSSSGLYTAVNARYLDAAGRVRVRYWTQAVPALDNAGVKREAFIDLGDNVGGVAANADQVAQAYLAQHKTPPNAGRLTIARPIYDGVRGRMVQPWEIRPGGLVRVRGVQPRTDGLNPAGRDGSTVFRVIGCEFTASSGTAVLELDSTPASVAALLAELQRGSGIRRR